MENHHFQCVNQLSMAIFYSNVKPPEGIIFWFGFSPHKDISRQNPAYIALLPSCGWAADIATSFFKSDACDPPTTTANIPSGTQTWQWKIDYL